MSEKDDNPLITNTLINQLIAYIVFAFSNYRKPENGQKICFLNGGLVIIKAIDNPQKTPQ